MNGGCCAWLTGLSGAGKSTIASRASEQLRDRGHQVEVLDGDTVRQALCGDLGFGREDRDVNVCRLAFIADLLARNGVVVIVAAISPYRAARDEARAEIGECFVEVHVDASVEECARRDVKGLYARAQTGEIESFTGISDPYEPPAAPELVLDTEARTPDDAAAALVDVIEERLESCRSRPRAG